MRGVFWTLAICALIHIILFSWFVTVASRKLDDGEKREQNLLERERSSDEKDRGRDLEKKKKQNENRKRNEGFDHN